MGSPVILKKRMGECGVGSVILLRSCPTLPTHDQGVVRQETVTHNVFSDFIRSLLMVRDERSGSVFLNVRSTQRGACCSEEGEKGVDPPRILEVEVQEAHEHGGGHDGR